MLAKGRNQWEQARLQRSAQCVRWEWCRQGLPGLGGAELCLDERDAVEDSSSRSRFGIGREEEGENSVQGAQRWSFWTGVRQLRLEGPKAGRTAWVTEAWSYFILEGKMEKKGPGDMGMDGTARSRPDPGEARRLIKFAFGTGPGPVC